MMSYRALSFSNSEEVKGLKVNSVTTKVMFGCETEMRGYVSADR